jgi:cytochrome P450
VRQGPNSLAFFTHTANAEIYGVRSNVSKTDGYATMSPSSEPNLISAVDKSVHAWKRRVMSQAMSDSFLKEMQSRVAAHIRGFVAMLGSEADVPDGKPVLDGWAPAKNLRVVCDWLTLSLVI